MIEDRADLHDLEVEKPQHEDELLAHRVYNQLILRPEHLFKVKRALARLGDGDDDRSFVHALEDGGPVLDISLVRVAHSSVHTRVIKVHLGRDVHCRLIHRGRVAL